MYQPTAAEPRSGSVKKLMYDAAFNLVQGRRDFLKKPIDKKAFPVPRAPPFTRSSEVCGQRLKYWLGEIHPGRV